MDLGGPGFVKSGFRLLKLARFVRPSQGVAWIMDRTGARHPGQGRSLARTSVKPKDEGEKGATGDEPRAGISGQISRFCNRAAGRSEGVCRPPRDLRPRSAGLPSPTPGALLVPLPVLAVCHPRTAPRRVSDPPVFFAIRGSGMGCASDIVDRPRRSD